MEFQDVDHLFDSFDDAFGLGLDVLDVGNDFHDAHEEIFVLLVFGVGRVLDDSVSSVGYEVSQVLESGFKLVGQKLSEHVDPGQNLSVQRVLQGLQGDL